MDNIKKEFKGFSGNELKVFAIIAMLMDHLASTIWRFLRTGHASRYYVPYIFIRTGGT